MKKFLVIKSSSDGVCGGNSAMPIDDAVEEICNFQGWDSLDQLRSRIKIWAAQAKPGQVFKTKYSVIVAAPHRS